MSSKPKPNYYWSILTMKCPRCRRGHMYKDNNPYKKLSLKQIFNMHDNCPVCHQKFDMENGFWFGTGYVSYALTVAISVATGVAWFVLIGMSVDDSRVFWWLGSNIALLVLLQPWLMRISRVIYIRFFVRYDDDFESHKPKEFDY
ncbi:MAG: DUF983 domain-containing protein [Bacteroidetes bacterium]|nr:DUF983 domain-containing protein [Bacteroidota bacterium]